LKYLTKSSCKATGVKSQSLWQRLKVYSRNICIQSEQNIVIFYQFPIQDKSPEYIPDSLSNLLKQTTLTAQPTPGGFLDLNTGHVQPSLGEYLDELHVGIWTVDMDIAQVLFPSVCTYLNARQV